MTLYDEQDYDTPDRYQQEHERTARERRAMYGADVPGGLARPGDPMCPEHRYGMVDGKCGPCVLSEREAGTARPVAADCIPPRSESAYGEEEAA